MGDRGWPGQAASDEKGLITDDGGGFFGWGVEQGHLGKTMSASSLRWTKRPARPSIHG